MTESVFIKASWEDWDSPSVSALRAYTQKLYLPRAGERERPALWDICSGCILWLPPKERISPDVLQRSPGLLDGNPRMFNHPVLVWDVKVTSTEDAVVKFMFMRSFKNHGEKELSRLNPRFLRIAHYSTSSGTIRSPVSDVSTEGALETPSPTSQDSKTVRRPEAAIQDLNIASKNEEHEERLVPNQQSLLHLERASSRRSMTKNSFVDTVRIYTIEWQELRCYAISQKPDGYRHRLNQESFNKVVEKTGRNKTSPLVPEWVESINLWETFVSKHINQNDAQVNGDIPMQHRIIPAE